MVDGKRYDWNEFDTLAIPGGSWYEHSTLPQGAAVPVRRQR